VCVFWGRPHFLRFSSDERDFTRLFPFSFLPSFLVFLKQAATTDLDALEKCVSSVAYGDLDAEPRGKLSEVKKEEGRRTRERETKRKRFFSGSEKIKSLIGVFSFPFLSLFFNARPSLPGLPPPPVPRSAADRAVPPARPGQARCLRRGKGAGARAAGGAEEEGEEGGGGARRGAGRGRHGAAAGGEKSCCEGLLREEKPAPPFRQRRLFGRCRARGYFEHQQQQQEAAAARQPAPGPELAPFGAAAGATAAAAADSRKQQHQRRPRHPLPPRGLRAPRGRPEGAPGAGPGQAARAGAGARHGRLGAREREGETEEAEKG